MNKIDKYIFCHIPKTGGHSVLRLIAGNGINAGHNICNKKNISDFLFAFVRHPYSRCLSAFEFLKKGGLNDNDKKDSEQFIGDSNFNHFVSTKLEHASKYQQHLRPQYYWIPNGADFIGRYENFNSDLENLRTLLVMNDEKITVNNRTDYDHNYIIDTSVKHIIYSIYKLDFDIFNYSP